MSTIRTTISLPDSLYRKALLEMPGKDFDSFSGYVAQLIREDVASRKPGAGEAHQIREVSPPYQVNKRKHNSRT